MHANISYTHKHARTSFRRAHVYTHFIHAHTHVCTRMYTLHSHAHIMQACTCISEVVQPTSTSSALSDLSVLPPPEKLQENGATKSVAMTTSVAHCLQLPNLYRLIWLSFPTSIWTSRMSAERAMSVGQRSVACK